MHRSSEEVRNSLRSFRYRNPIDACDIDNIHDIRVIMKRIYDSDWQGSWQGTLQKITDSVNVALNMAINRLMNRVEEIHDPAEIPDSVRLRQNIFDMNLDFFESLDGDLGNKIRAKVSEDVELLAFKNLEIVTIYNCQEVLELDLECEVFDLIRLGIIVLAEEKKNIFHVFGANAEKLASFSSCMKISNNHLQQKESI